MLQLAHFVTAVDAIKRATESGDLERGVHLTGQVQGLIRDIPTVKEVIELTVHEAVKIHASMTGQLAQ